MLFLWNYWFHETGNQKTARNYWFHETGNQKTAIFDGTTGSMKLVMRRGYPKTVPALVSPNNNVELV